MHKMSYNTCASDAGLSESAEPALPKDDDGDAQTSCKDVGGSRPETH